MTAQKRFVMLEILRKLEEDDRKKKQQDARILRETKKRLGIH